MRAFLKRLLDWITDPFGRAKRVTEERDAARAELEKRGASYRSLLEVNRTLFADRAALAQRESELLAENLRLRRERSGAAAWQEEARRYAENADFWRGVVEECRKLAATPAPIILQTPPFYPEPTPVTIVVENGGSLTLEGTFTCG